MRSGVDRRDMGIRLSQPPTGRLLAPPLRSRTFDSAGGSVGPGRPGRGIRHQSPLPKQAMGAGIDAAVMEVQSPRLAFATRTSVGRQRGGRTVRPFEER
jgi:hypothetical protein